MVDRSDVMRLALQRAKLCEQADQDQRKREQDDLAFQVPENQWDEATKNDRRAMLFPAGNSSINLPQRPLVAIPKLDQPVQLILNQERQAHLGIDIVPLSEEADEETADALEDLYRSIERNSRADLARSFAFERATKCGRGFYRILKEHCAVPEDTPDDDPRWWDQEIVIKRILYQEAVRFDPFAQEPDNSDAEYCFVFQDLPFERYKRTHPHTTLAMYDGSDLQALRGDGEDAPDWINGDNESGWTVRVAEYFRREKTVEVLDGPDGRSRQREHVAVQWSLINGIEEIESQEWDGQYIPIVTVIGRELIPMNGKRVWFGVYSSAKDLQRLYNAQATAVVESLQTLAKAPYLLAEGQAEGYEDMWAQLAVRNFPYLVYRPTDLNGNPVPPPQRNEGNLSVVQSLMVGLQQTNNDIQASTATFDPSLGNLSQQDRSGKAILAQQQQADASNSNYLDNLARVSLTYEAKVVLDLMPKVYDRAGRVEMVRGINDESKTVMFNQPYTMNQRGKPQPVQPGQQPEGAKEYNLKAGRYGVAVSVGKSYDSRMQQGAEELGQVLQADPQLMPLIGPIYFKYRDFPGHLEVADLLKKVRAKQFPGIDEKDQQGPSVEQLQAQLQQGGQTVQMLTQELQAKTQFIETEQAKHQADLQKTQMDNEAKITIERMHNETQLAVAEINATKDVQGKILAMEQARVGVGMNNVHDAMERALDRDHQQELAVKQAALGSMQADQQHAQGLDAADQSHQQALQQGDQQHAQALEQGAQAGQQAMDQQQQAADVAPEPTGGE